MRVNNRYTILIVAALIAALTAVMVRNRLSSTASAVDNSLILVAKRDLSPGDFIKSTSDLDWAKPVGDQKDGAHIAQGSIRKGDFNGGVVRKPIKAGSAIAPDQITKAGDGGFLSAVLEPGMRAVAIAVTATTSAAGFIAPGDRVDLIVTQKMKTSRSNSSGGQEAVMSETFVHDVRVVAIDQSLDGQENKAVVAKNVTVEVNEQQAEQISVASEMGKISLALLSSVPAPGEEGGVDSRADKKDGAIFGRKNNAMPRVQVIRGKEKEELQFIDRGRR